MPTNLDALLRYHTIDRCLQNRFRKWTWEDLSEACFEALDEIRYRDSKVGVSKRTIENDIRIMRSDILGYNAPIVCEKGQYRYSDPEYSIKNASLKTADVFNISIAAKILGHYKGFNLHDDLSEIVTRVETKLQVAEYDDAQRVIQFEGIPPSKGQEFLKPFADAITQRTVLKLHYQRFDKPGPWEHVLHPYLLKEYRNRWYLLGFNPKVDKITTYALDRIVGYEPLPEVKYITNIALNPDEYFRHTIGITYTGEPPIRIRLFVKQDFIPYLETQPLHASQRRVGERTDGAVYELEVVNNPELQTLLLGFADIITVEEPAVLRNQLGQRLQAASSAYGEIVNKEDHQPNL
ncbi:helix-turn-helix transcriptional regulator [Parapedobacter sp. DT-150]|uniref:helix-turn-helix transcriptional regulator n=1 Tax=Parapedobacter sp. DT-150 TaxID=3396162 RepID=UPI003F1B0A8F